MSRFKLKSIGCIALGLALSACGGSGSNSTAPGTSAPLTSASVLSNTASTGATALPVTLPATQNDPIMQLLPSNLPASVTTTGWWSNVQSWPFNALHTIMLPSGKMLSFGALPGRPDLQNGRYWDVWDPTQGFGANSHNTSAVANPVDSFCGTAAFINNGSLLVASGSSNNAGANDAANNAQQSELFDPVSSKISTASSTLSEARWYGTMLTLPDGRALMMGGSIPYVALYQTPDTAIMAGTVSMTPEVYSTKTGWSSLPGAYSRTAFGPDYNRWVYPRSWVAPNGKVFGISAEQMWYLDPNANQGLGAVTSMGQFKTPADNNALPNIGATSTAVMYAPGKILQVGGNGYYNGFAINGVSLSSPRATIIDINGAKPVVTDTASMTYSRQWASSLVLPDGQVLVTGGTIGDYMNPALAVYTAELWNPTTGKWTLAASAAVIRVYHSTTTLLPNGTALSTGGGAPGPVNNANAEVYFPPYLFTSVNGVVQFAKRPQLKAISATQFLVGDTIQLDVSSPNGVGKVALIGNTAGTHAFNSGQRFRNLAFTTSAGVSGSTRLNIPLHLTTSDIPPGNYQLVVLDKKGVPSTAAMISIGLQGGTPNPTPSLPKPDTAVSLTPMYFPTYRWATDSAGYSYIAQLNGNTDPATLIANGAAFYLRQGLADSACVSFESYSQPGYFLRHANFRMQVRQNDGSQLFQYDATFCPQNGYSGAGGVTFQSKNYPNYVMRHANYTGWLTPIDVDTVVDYDATFLVRPVFAVATP